MNCNVIFICQYNFGIGHWVRSLCLCEAIKKRNPNARVTLVNGGEPLGGISSKVDKIVQLPPVKKQSLFSSAQSGNKETHQKRTRIIGELINSDKPTHFITEFYPFSPERMHAMIGPHLPLLKRRGVCLISSIRDIPVSDCHGSLSGQTEKVHALLSQFDVVLHHTDPSVCNTSHIDGLAELFAGKTIIETGYVVRQGFTPQITAKENALYVSVGGGRDGLRMFESIKDYLLYDSLSQFEKVNLVCGPKMPTKDQGDILKQFKKNGISIHFGFYNTFNLISKARVAITMAGYNSLAEFASTGTRCLMLPRKGSFEQELRAKLFAAHGLGVVGGQMTKSSIRTEIEKILSMNNNYSLDATGGRRVATYLAEGFND